MGIGSIGFTEILVIAVIVLVFFGPQRLPEVTRALGGAMREFRRSLNEIQREIEQVDRTRKRESAATPQPVPPSSEPRATVPVDAVTPAPPEETTGETPADRESRADRETRADGETPTGPAAAGESKRASAAES